ncbi:MAG: glycosyltransferase family 2 protein [Gammaproteobacteria bacterium]|nr:glycosyltransferase family 2 protein [Gammaproteobacteria bacterium]
MITVVIPYFQRSPGILAKALASIAAQEGCPLPIQVIVVDDASPAPVAAELAGSGAMPHPVRVITQANGGPGAARNTGLDHAPPGTRYLAFLDSDDEWMPDHLARAVAALACGYDFFFADHYQLDQASGAFARGGRLELERHPLLPTVQADLHAYAGDMLDQTIRGNLIGTSTVVYHFERFAAQRFQVEFANAGEDYLFWMALMVQGALSAFSTHTAARYGKGVNIYAGAGWGSE